MCACRRANQKHKFQNCMSIKHDRLMGKSATPKHVELALLPLFAVIFISVSELGVCCSSLAKFGNYAEDNRKQSCY